MIGVSKEGAFYMEYFTFIWQVFVMILFIGVITTLIFLGIRFVSFTKIQKDKAIESSNPKNEIFPKS